MTTASVERLFELVERVKAAVADAQARASAGNLSRAEHVHSSRVVFNADAATIRAVYDDVIVKARRDGARSLAALGRLMAQAAGAGDATVPVDQSAMKPALMGQTADLTKRGTGGSPNEWARLRALHAFVASTRVPMDEVRETGTPPTVWCAVCSPLRRCGGRTHTPGENYRPCTSLILWWLCACVDGCVGRVCLQSDLELADEQVHDTLFAIKQLQTRRAGVPATQLPAYDAAIDKRIRVLAHNGFFVYAPEDLSAPVSLRNVFTNAVLSVDDAFDATKAVPEVEPTALGDATGLVYGYGASLCRLCCSALCVCRACAAQSRLGRVVRHSLCCRLCPCCALLQRLPTVARSCRRRPRSRPCPWATAAA